jgi:Na+-translocating ferredoxin:NAD+ oxidoreductase subunit E
MNEDLKKSLFLNSPMRTLIFGVGIIAPLYAGLPLQAGVMLGILAILLLTVSTIILSSLRSVVPKNGRIGSVIILTGGLLTMAKIALAAVPLAVPLPVETLAPLLLIVAVLASVTDSYDVKKKFLPAFFDGAALGLSFSLLLCLSGVLRDLLGNGAFNNVSILAGFQPLRIFVLVPGALLIAALITALLPKKRRSAA